MTDGEWEKHEDKLAENERTGKKFGNPRQRRKTKQVFGRRFAPRLKLELSVFRFSFLISPSSISDSALFLVERSTIFGKPETRVEKLDGKPEACLDFSSLVFAVY